MWTGSRNLLSIFPALRLSMKKSRLRMRLLVPRLLTWNDAHLQSCSMNEDQSDSEMMVRTPRARLVRHSSTGINRFIAWRQCVKSVGYVLALLTVLFAFVTTPSFAVTSNISCFKDINTGECVYVGDSATNTIKTSVIGSAGGTSSTFGAAFPATGTAAGFSDGTSMQPGRTVDADTGAGTVNVQGVNLLKRAAGGPVEAGTAADPLRVDPTGTTAQPVTGTFFQATQPVSGPLTDVQLRATPVPVSGTVTVNVGLTDAQLRATPVPVSGTVTTTPPANASTNVAQFGGNAVVTGTGASGLGIPRVTVSNDSTVILGTGAATIGALTANQSVNLAQVGGTTTVNGGLAGSLAIGGTSANNTAITQNPDLIGCESLTYGTQPTASTTGNLRRIPCTTEGAIAITPGHNRFSCFVQAVTVTTQCQAAPAAGLRAYILSVTLSNQAATVQTLDIIFGTGANCVTAPTALTHKWQFGTVATTTSPFVVSHNFNSPLVPTAANAICVRPTAATVFGATITGYIAP